MSDLAFNLNGDPFDVPPHAVGWRVRRMKAKGAPEVVYGRNGQPLVLPLEADLDDVRAEVGTAGRYRFDPVGDDNKPIEGAPAGYIFVHEASAQPATAMGSTSAPRSAPADNLIAEAMRMNADIARSVVDRFPQMLEAAAALLRAADGAGLPTRVPRVIEVDEEADEDEDTQPRVGFDVAAFLGQVAPLLAPLLSNLGKGGMPSVAEALDWRKAAPADPRAPAGRLPSRASAKASRADGPGDAVASSQVPETATDVLPPIDPQTMAHFIAIQAALKPEEARLAREVASNLSAPELHAWFDDLKALTVPQAVQKLRVLIAGNTEAVP